MASERLRKEVTAISTPFEDETRRGLVKIEEWMDGLSVGDSESLVELLDRCGSTWEGDWSAGTKAAVLAVLERCLPKDFDRSVGPDRSEVKPANSDTGWVHFWAGDYIHMVAKLDADRYGLALHQGGAMFEGMKKELA